MPANVKLTFMNRVFELHQNIRLMVNEYRVLDTDKAPAELLAFARQKRLAIREQFTLYKDQQQKEILATSKARSVVDLGATYDIYGSDGKQLAQAKKDFKKSLLTSTWHISTANGKQSYTLREKSPLVAIVRRLWDFLPIVDIVPFPLKFHFVILKDSAVVGEYIKTTLFRDRYALYLEKNEKELDIRAWMIIAVLLDAMQSR